MTEAADKSRARSGTRPGPAGADATASTRRRTVLPRGLSRDDLPPARHGDRLLERGDLGVEVGLRRGDGEEGDGEQDAGHEGGIVAHGRGVEHVCDSPSMHNLCDIDGEQFDEAGSTGQADVASGQAEVASGWDDAHVEGRLLLAALLREPSLVHMADRLYAEPSATRRRSWPCSSWSSAACRSRET